MEVQQDATPLAPANLPTEEAGALGADGVTALTGLEYELKLREGENPLIFGASGGIGHMAVQLAKRMGVRVLAVASGKDGVDLVSGLGADAAVDGRKDDVASAVREFAAEDLDAALVLANGKELQRAYPAGTVAAPRV